MWNRTPPVPHDAHTVKLIVILGLVLYANVIVNEMLEPAWYVPFNLGLLGVTLVIARSAGTTWTSMGLRRDRTGTGVKIGLAAAAAAVALAAIALTVPAVRELLRDERFVDSSIGLLLYHALIRIPIGTALYEEVLFRGVIFGMLVRRYPPLIAGLSSSLLFGLWHILPVLDVLETNPAGDHFSGVLAIIGALIAAVVITSLAGLGLLWIRLLANSIVAPVLVHIGTNSMAILAVIVVVHLA